MIRLIAVMLSWLRMSINECIDAYLFLLDRIFQKKRHCATIKGNIQGRFDSEELVQAVKEVVAAQKLQEDALLKDTLDNVCKVQISPIIAYDASRLLINADLRMQQANRQAKRCALQAISRYAVAATFQIALRYRRHVAPR